MSSSSPSAIALEAVIFDWAGTLVDFGSLAPTQIFVDAFKSFDIHITLEQARGPMGLSKWQHIQALLAEPAIARQWQQCNGHAPTDKDIDAIYSRFMPMQIAKVGEYSQVSPGLPPRCAGCAARAEDRLLLRLSASGPGCAVAAGSRRRHRTRPCDCRR